MYEKDIEVVDGLRRAFEHFKHYQELTKRTVPFMEKELPGYTVSLIVGTTAFGGHKNYTLSVWGNGIEYTNRVYLTWSDVQNSQPRTWQEGFLAACDVADMRDYRERKEQEESLIPQLRLLEQEVRDRIKQAQKLISDLPTPTSAKGSRKESHMWENPSVELSKQFPLLFKNNI